MNDKISKNKISTRRAQKILSQELIMYLLYTHAEEISLELIWPKTMSNVIIDKIMRHRIARQIFIILISDYGLEIHGSRRIIACIEKMLAIMGIGTPRNFDKTINKTTL